MCDFLPNEERKWIAKMKQSFKSLMNRVKLFILNKPSRV